MKLYVSSYRIPSPDELETLLGKPLRGASVALIPNAKDYYSERARNFKINTYVRFMTGLGLNTEVVDLRNFNDPMKLQNILANYDLIWVMGGNTFVLRYEMRRSGFEKIIRNLLEAGVVYGGDSAGALVAGDSIAGVESVDEPAFAEEIITDGLSLVPFVILPHVDNPNFTSTVPVFEDAHKNKSEIIMLKDSQAAIFENDTYRIAVNKSDSDSS